jgi:hypothetical protein
LENPAREKWAKKAIENGWSAYELKFEYERAEFAREIKKAKKELEASDVQLDISIDPSVAEDSGLSFEDLEEIIHENDFKIVDFLYQAMETVVEEIDYVLKGRSSKEVTNLYNDVRASARCLHEQLKSRKILLQHRSLTSAT